MIGRPDLPLRDPAVLIVSGLGSGLLRPGPGTWGSIVAVALWWLVLKDLPWQAQALAAALLLAVGTWLTDRVGRRYGVTDDPRIVVDEFVGVWIALIAAPATPRAALIALLLFRVLDIFKPWPIGALERRVPGALGVMIDDVAAGLLVLAVLQLAFPALGWSGALGSP